MSTHRLDLTVIDSPMLGAVRLPENTRRRHDGRSATQRKILEATGRLLVTHSARDIGVESIAGEAGLSKATFYHYFDSKWAVVEHLVTSVMESVYHRIEPFIDAAGDASGGEDTEAALRASIAEGCRVWADHRAILRAVTEHWREVPELRAIWLGLFERFRNGIAGAIERERAAGRARTDLDSGDIAATLIWSTAYCLYVAGLDEIEIPGDEERLRATLTEMWLRTIYLDATR